MTPSPQSPPTTRRRALLVVEECNPEWPSLPGVGYRAAAALARVADVTVATHVRNRPGIERSAEAGFAAKVVYVDTEYVAAPMYKLARLLRGGDKVAWRLALAMKYPSRLAFDRVLWKRLGKDLRAGRFDVAQRITPMSPTLPSPLARKLARHTRVPFVLGPLNGGLPWPAAFSQEQAREKEKLPFVRGLSRRLPFYRSTYRHSAAILAAFNHTITDLPPGTRDKTIDFPEVGIDPALFHAPQREGAPERLTILYAGRLVPYKLPEVVVRAFALNPALRRHRLILAGDGPERPRLESLVAEHDLGDCVTLTGNVPQPRVGELMREADVFAFPSIRELGAGVVVEAMACGLACVVVDYGGPAGLIDADCGVKVPMGTLEELAAAYAAALGDLAADPARVRRLGSAAREHALRFYDWDAKALKTLEVYDWVLGEGAKPDFWDAPTGDAAG